MAEAITMCVIRGLLSYVEMSLDTNQAAREAFPMTIPMHNTSPRQQLLTGGPWDHEYFVHNTHIVAATHQVLWGCAETG